MFWKLLEKLSKIKPKNESDACEKRNLEAIVKTAEYCDTHYDDGEYVSQKTKKRIEELEKKQKGDTL